MAPAFGFSYRGAYYLVPLRKQDIFDILDTTQPKELIKLSRSIAKRVGGDTSVPGQKTLFEIQVQDGFEEAEDGL